MIERTIILDNVVQSNVPNLDKNSRIYVEERWYNLDTYHDYQNVCLSLIKIASDYYDLSSCTGYEFWAHHNNRPTEWHIDKDERRLWKDGVINCPLCSIVYYPFVEDLIDGKLFLLEGESDLKDDIIITPQLNRLIIFPPQKKHYVGEFMGKRSSIIVNPWDGSKYLYPDPKLKIY
tara:strand:- start:88 stop:615 length:528 start_codon:yes stop_codon:yes gene_type:complete